MDKNPFSVLGLTREVLTGLSDEQIKILIDSQWKAMQRIFHPDAGTINDKRSKELNEAKELLEDERFFKQLKEQYQKPLSMKKREQILQQSLTISRNNYNRLYQFIVEYLIAMANLKEEPTIFDLQNYELGMHDTYLGTKEPIYLNSLDPSRDNNFTAHYYLTIDEDGKITKRFTKRARKGLKTDHNEIDVRTEIVENRLLIGLFKAPSLGLKTEGDVLNFMIRVQEIDYPEKTLEALPGTTRRTKMENSRFSLLAFRSIMPYLSPILDKGGYLFSLAKSGQDIFFILEGKVISYSVLD